MRINWIGDYILWRGRWKQSVRSCEWAFGFPTKRDAATIEGMTSEALRNLLARRPFEPMRVTMSSGRTYEIRHPEMAALAKSGLVITLPEPDGSPSDQVEFCSYLHIASVETMAFA